MSSLNLNKLRLKWKVFVFLLGFCALLLIILWLFQTVFLDSFYRNVRMLEIEHDAQTIANGAGNDDIANIIKDISENRDATVHLTDLNGISLLNPFQMQDRRIMETNAALISRAGEKGGEYSEYFTQQTASPRYGPRPDGGPPMRSLIYARIFDGAETGEFAVIIHAIISPVSATVTTLRYQLYFITVIMMVLAGVLAMLISRRVSKPIEEISRSAMTLAKGNYDTRFSGKGFYEIVALSETLNTTAAELGKVEGLRRELMANVSHDLRTPLSLIYSYAEMMNDFPGEITAEQTAVIMDETRRLTSLVNDVLDLSKLESDMELLSISRFNITQNILGTSERMEELLKNDGFEVNFSGGGDVYADADEAKIGRAFYNLLINAVNYSGDSRVISVSQTVSGNRVRISVSDNGEGIAEEELPFIWDRYYKSGRQHKRAVTGSGMGLSIVKRIIELHGGSYGVQSTFGEGSTFWFEIDRQAG